MAGVFLGAVPAAGRSTRIGNPKALLDADGATFLDRTVSALRGGGAEPIVVGVRHPRGPIHAAAGRAGAHPLVPDEVDEGPLATIRTALHWFRERRSHPDLAGIFVLPVDHPRVRADTVEELRSAFLQQASAPPLVRPLHEGRAGFPLLLGPDLFGTIRDSAGRGRPLSELVAEYDGGALLHPVADRGVLVDIDTLADYRRHFPRAYRRRFQKW